MQFSSIKHWIKRFHTTTYKGPIQLEKEELWYGFSLKYYSTVKTSRIKNIYIFIIKKFIIIIQ